MLFLESFLESIGKVADNFTFLSGILSFILVELNGVLVVQTISVALKGRQGFFASSGGTPFVLEGDLAGEDMADLTDGCSCWKSRV